MLADALALWRGSPLAEFADEPFAREAILRLEELRLEAIEARIEADLMLGRDRGLVAELEGVVAAHPLRERPRAQLMLALYRCGRQADALAVYRQTRKLLDEELGLEPGDELRRLENAMLAHDPRLELPAAVDSAAWPSTGVGSEQPGDADHGEGPVAERDRAALRHDSALEPAPRATTPPSVVVGRRALLVAGGVVLLLAAIMAAAVELTGDSVRVRVTPNSLAAIDPRNNRVVGAVAVGARPSAIAFGSGSLWVANVDDETVSRVDPTDLRTLRTLPMRGVPTGIAASGSAIWVATAQPRSSNVSVTRVDPAFDALAPAARIDNVVPGGPGAIAARGNTLWVAPSFGLLSRVDAATGRVVRRVDPNAGPTAIDVGDGAVWLTDAGANNVTRVDPTGLVTPIAVGHGPTGIAFGERAVWVADSQDDAVVRIDPTTRAVTATIPVGRTPHGVAVGAGAVWVANSGDGTVSRIDPRSASVQATIAVGGSPQAITVAGGRTWVTVDQQTIAPAARAPDGTLRMQSALDVDYMDPALAYLPISWQLLYATCAKLLNYPDKSGPAGARLTPEVATSLPAVSADGRTYTFTLRGGFRFSPPSNQPVTAQTFKATIERALNPRTNGPLAREFVDLAGAEAYMAGKAPHIAGVVARGDALTIRLRKPLPDFLSRLAQPIFCAVPPTTPIDPKGVLAIPSAGPYYVTSYTPGQGIVLARNPNYHGGRPHQLARIELTPRVLTARAIANIDANRADHTTMSGSSARALASRLATRYGPGSPAAAARRQRYFVGPGRSLDFLALNTHRPLFGDVRIRRAVSYAIDRGALARLGNLFFSLPDRPTDRYLLPGMPGFRSTPIHSLAPDLAKATRLTNGKPRTAILYTCNSSPCDQQAQIVKTDLAAIGIRIHVKTFPWAALLKRITRPGEPFDLAPASWTPDYPDPSTMLTPLLRDSLNLPTFDDPTYQRRLAGTDRLIGPQRYVAYGKLARDLARNAAPLVAFGNTSTHDYFSTRIGCQSYGFYGLDLAALCITAAK